MIINDFHVHSSFSGDCHVKMEEMIEYAINKKLENLCFTEHHDQDLADSDISFLLNFQAYYDTFQKLKDKYSDKINLLLGIELGIQPQLYSELSKITRNHPYDFILCSSHVSNGIDPYNLEYFHGKTKEVAYTQYFETILECAKNYTDYDVYGHLDYVIRYYPHGDKHYKYQDYQDILDEILSTIINAGKGIEINTAGFKYNLGDSHPSTEVIKRYRELGGEIITVGSDAHQPHQLCNYFDLANNILLASGFKYYSIFKQRKPEFIKL
ncbi:MAG: histidinol phosphate phosphatase [Firmicutes bacterium HGW-Firmicutes-7]|nr:MAG: histidinol phosphate phosphatase [Firmicutes bacterium HGW-Firmicutes-7]